MELTDDFVYSEPEKDGFVYAPPEKPLGLMDRLREYKKKKDQQALEEANKPVLKQLIHRLGNAPLTPSAGNLVAAVRRAVSAEPDKPWDIEKALPNPTFGGLAKGLSDLPIGAGQIAAHATGVGEGTMDSIANFAKDYYDKNLDQSRSGELVGQALPFIASGGASAVPKAASVGKGLARYAGDVLKGGAITALSTPETEVKNDADFWARKQGEFGAGSFLSAAIPAVGAIARPIAKGLNQTKNNFAETPSVNELLDDISSGYGGGRAGEALQKAANDIYNTKYSQFKSMIAPVDEVAGEVPVAYHNALDAVRNSLERASTGVSPLTETEHNYFLNLYNRLNSAMGNQSPVEGISNKLDSAMQLVHNLGETLGALTKKGETVINRADFHNIRDAVLKDIEESTLQGKQYGDARRFFREEIVPLFDREQGGNWVAKVRDGWNPNDIIASLAKSKNTDRLHKVAEGASADPLVHEIVSQAKTAAAGAPSKYNKMIQSAMPGIEEIASPELASKVADTARVSRFANRVGVTGDIAGVAALSHLPIIGGPAAFATGYMAHSNPAGMLQGQLWKLVQTPGFRKQMSRMWNIPVNTPEFDKSMARFLALLTAENNRPQQNVEQQ